MPPAKNLTWIHLSDLHFGHGKEAAPRFDQKVVTAEIIRDAELVAGELSAPDFIFLTGDIAFSASAEKEYPAAGEWLGKLLAALKIGPERLLLVPGNHDVDRKKALEGASRLAHGGLRAKPEEVNELLEKAAEMEVIWPKLTAYQKFASVFGSPEISPAKPFWTKRLSSALGPVEVIGLNTALLSFDGSDSPTTLALGIGQLQRALEEPKRDALLVVLLHHPPEWLRDGGDLRAMLKPWPHLLLCGHVHEQQGFVHLPIASRGGVELVAGAGHQDANELGEHAYAWGRLHSAGLDYYPRAWLKRETSFLPQRIRPPEDQKGYSPKLGEFARFPAAKLPEALATWLASSAAGSPAAPIADSTAESNLLRAPTPEPVSAALAGVVVASFDPANAHFSIPYKAKGDQVIGRADALRKVREQLERGRPTAIGQTAAFVGLGGLGKTQLAVEYAHAYKSHYPGGVYWFNADEDLDAQLTRLAVAARWVSPASEPRFMLEIARHQIRNRSNCLIVLDNVEERAAIEALLPESSATPHLLITSRVSQVGFDPVPIDRLLDEQSLELLRTESGRSLEKPADHDAALRIAKQLEGLPLALELAGAFLRRSQGVSWASYADLLEREGVKARGLGDGPLASFTKHNADLYATLRIDESLFENSPLLREALDLLAWSGSASMGRRLLAVLLNLDDGSSAALDVALGEAETLRILKQEQGTTDPANPRFHMHRLVREVRRAEVSLEREPARWLAVLERLGSWFEERRQEFANLAAYEAEVDHLEVWQGHATRVGYVREAARLLWLRAYPHYHQGQFRRVHDMVQSALALFEDAAVVDLELEAHLRSDLGTTLRKLGASRKALDYQTKALDIRREILGEKHPATAQTLNNVGTTLSSLGDRWKALDYQQRALDIRREVLGEHHSDTAASLNNVGTTLSNFGEHRKALGYQERALAIRREVLGEHHPATAESLNNVGTGLSNLGEHRKALGYQERALHINIEILGEKHPQTAHSFNSLGFTLENLGEPIKALNFMDMALAVRQETLGDRHPDTIRSWERIVGFLLRQRKKADALMLIERDLKKFPHNAALRRLKNEILGKKSAQAPRQASTPSKKPKPPKR